ncbi:alpha/beta hydrolase [Hathewaya histolytica]|uniref:alpha/beta hydrolase n=1 Tax=Hathewaya histolytica TaxID=1498 RepID=UPI003B674D8B
MAFKKTSKNKTIKWANILIGIILLSCLSCFAISIYVGLNLAMPKREPITNSPKNYGLSYENVSFHSKYDDILLKGWWIPAQNNGKHKESKKTIIFAHGYGDNRALMDIEIINIAKRLCNEGYNVLTFDFRAAGESEGKIVSLGEFEKYDLLTAVDFARNNKQSEKIGLVGWSMGAATSILVGEMSKDVQAVVADSPFASLEGYLKANLPYWTHLPDFPFTNIILGVLPYIIGVDIADVNGLKAIPNYKNKDLLLIHGKGDLAISYKESEKLYNIARKDEHVKLWITEKAEHIRTYKLYKKEYEKNILDFFHNSLK